MICPIENHHQPTDRPRRMRPWTPIGASRSRRARCSRRISRRMRRLSRATRSTFWPCRSCSLSLALLRADPITALQSTPRHFHWMVASRGERKAPQGAPSNLTCTPRWRAATSPRRLISEASVSRPSLADAIPAGNPWSRRVCRVRVRAVGLFGSPRLSAFPEPALHLAAEHGVKIRIVESHELLCCIPQPSSQCSTPKCVRPWPMPCLVDGHGC
jgi:hypothetical protein